MLNILRVVGIRQYFVYTVSGFEWWSFADFFKKKRTCLSNCQWVVGFNVPIYNVSVKQACCRTSPDRNRGFSVGCHYGCELND